MVADTIGQANVHPHIEKEIINCCQNRVIPGYLAQFKDYFTGNQPIPNNLAEQIDQAVEAFYAKKVTHSAVTFAVEDTPQAPPQGFNKKLLLGGGVAALAGLGALAAWHHHKYAEPASQEIVPEEPVLAIDEQELKKLEKLLDA